MRISPKHTTGILLIALATLPHGSALAAEPSPAWNDLLAIEGHLGLGAPMGLAGLALDLTPHPQVSFNVGAGRGLFAMQVAAMARVRPFFFTSGLAPGIGIGVSGGDTGTGQINETRELRFDKAMWLNGEVSLELRRGAFHLRPYAGLAWRFRHSSCTYTDSQEDTARPCYEVDQRNVTMLDNWQKILYTGVTIGISLM